MENKKRYCVIFNLWGEPGKHYQKSETWYDTWEEVLEEIKLLEEFYGPTPRPMKVNGVPDFSEGGRFWGYIVLDFSESKILKIAHDGISNVINRKTSGIDYLRVLDRYFRSPNEIPEGYKWDEGEYEGWLQFRWGDGKNAIGYVEPLKPPRPPKEITDEPYDPLLDPDYELEEEIIGELLEDRFAKDIERELKEMKDYKW